MVASPKGLEPECGGPAAIVNDRPVLSSERVPNKNKTVTVKESCHEPQMSLDIKTYRLAVSRNVTWKVKEMDTIMSKGKTPRKVCAAFDQKFSYQR
jgi:hypothetical protein